METKRRKLRKRERERKGDLKYKSINGRESLDWTVLTFVVYAIRLKKQPEHLLSGCPALHQARIFRTSILEPRHFLVICINSFQVRLGSWELVKWFPADVIPARGRTQLKPRYSQRPLTSNLSNNLLNSWVLAMSICHLVKLIPQAGILKCHVQALNS